MPIISVLKQLGFSEKETQVYLALLNLGPAPVRQIAQKAQINRGTTYDILKSLIKRGLVSYYHQDKHQYFLAEDPDKLKDYLEDRRKELDAVKQQMENVIPEMKSIYNKAGQKPVVRYYEGSRAIKTILQDVLKVMDEAEEKEYYVYSSSDVRAYLYRDFPNFAKERVKLRIKVKAIAIGSGGALWGLDERKWLSKKEGSPTYIIIYHKKVALISLSPDKIPHGVIIEDKNIFETQKIIFESLWQTLK